MVINHENRNYSHPYSPYQIQLDLMDAIYSTIEDGYKVGIFESPTGTGKTLSIICAAMTWLRDYKRQTIFKDNSEANVDSDSDEDWVKQDYQNSIVSSSKNSARDFEDHLTKVRSDYIMNVQEAAPLKKKPKLAAKISESEYLPVDYDSDTESSNSKLKEDIDCLLNKTSVRTEDNTVEDFKPKLFFSSRTHSQLNQFANQLRLTHFEATFEGLSERTKYTPLASRKQLCINEKVKTSARSDTAINDACLDLQRLKDSKCTYFPKPDLDLSSKFSDLALSSIHDIEDLADLGLSLKTCPYYSIRRSVTRSEIIAVPYQMILDINTRRTLQLDVKDSIVIIDEAHNLLDTITSLNSVSITQTDLEVVVASLKSYLGRFLRRLNGGNRMNVMKLIKICQAMITFIKKTGKVNAGTPISMVDLLTSANVDLFNIHKLETFLNITKIAYKIQFYLESERDTQGPSVSHHSSSSNPLLFKIVKFLKSLNNPSKEGKFFWGEEDGVPSLNYMLLDPSDSFKTILDDAKCVLLLGGTMEPITDFTTYLLPSVPNHLINTFSCGHLIPPENLKVFTVPKHRSIPFEFLFTERNNKELIANLGETFMGLCETVPNGVVAFFPSYLYLNKVLEQWKLSGLFDKLNRIKRIFTEDSQRQDVLQEYTNCVRSEVNGALLVSVVGGKMSEGINFSDDLARGVIMVGLPYPNAFSGSIIAKRRFIEERTIENGGTSQEAYESSHNYYDNLCMKAINQSIGRSIRHINDYAIIYLIDVRYVQEKIQKKLSGWVRERLDPSKSWDAIVQKSAEFFMSKSILKE